MRWNRATHCARRPALIAGAHSPFVLRAHYGTRDSLFTTASAEAYSLELDWHPCVPPPGIAAILSSSTKGLFEKFGVGKEKRKDTTAEKKEKRTWFANLSIKTRKYLNQILHTADESKGAAGMKWDVFVKVCHQCPSLEQW